MSGLKAPGVWFITLLAALLAVGVSAANAQDSDDPSRKVADTVPEFGGSYWDGDVLVINLTNNTAAVLRRAHEALIRFLGADYDVSNVVGREIRFGWAELEGWFLEFLRSPAVEGVTKIDHNHRLNRLSLGIESEDVRAAVTDRLVELGIPTEAVVMRVEPPPFPAVVSSRRQPLLFAGLALVLVLAASGFLVVRHRLGRSARDERGRADHGPTAPDAVDQLAERQHTSAAL